MFSNTQFKNENQKFEIREYPPEGTRKPEASPYAPERIEVAVAVPSGEPRVLRVKKRRVQVKEVVNMWRIDEEWWRKPISRLYFSLELENGARVTVFHDLATREWYRQNWV